MLPYSISCYRRRPAYVRCRCYTWKHCANFAARRRISTFPTYTRNCSPSTFDLPLSLPSFIHPFILLFFGNFIVVRNVGKILLLYILFLSFFFFGPSSQFQPIRRQKMGGKQLDTYLMIQSTHTHPNKNQMNTLIQA